MSESATQSTRNAGLHSTQTWSSASPNHVTPEGQPGGSVIVRRRIHGEQAAFTRLVLRRGEARISAASKPNFAGK